MTVEALLIIIGFCLFACYLVYKWQESVVDMAVPPYQEPVKPDMAEQWVEVNKEAKLEATPLNPQAAWPFPSGPKP
jgi:hypothetical protein